MRGYQVAGILWIVAAMFAVATTLRFRGDTAVWAVTNVASLIAAIIGVLLMWTPSRALVRVSTVGGVAWGLLYAALAIIQGRYPGLDPGCLHWRGRRGRRIRGLPSGNPRRWYRCGGSCVRLPARTFSSWRCDVSTGNPQLRNGDDEWRSYR
jgi:hypothetical protein